MKYAVCLLVAFVCSGAFASEPGQPLGCEDWVTAAPGLTVAYDYPQSSFGYGLVLTDRVAFDNEGGRIVVGNCCVPTPSPCDSNAERLLIRRENRSGVVEALACLPSRTTDHSEIALSGCYLNNSVGWSNSCVRFNPITGDLHFSYDQVGSGYQRSTVECVLHGLPTLYDVQQTYVPTSAFGFYVPAMPEGMAAADHFDTYWGHLTHPLDFTQAHSLQCDYPAAAPQVGDYLTVADTVPTPAPGQGVYYLTSATYQGATRYGRKATGGHLTGRDPALLPACTTP